MKKRPKISLYIAQSLDGFVATPDQKVDWLDPFNDTSFGDYGYQDFVDTVDSVAVGSTTFKQFHYIYPEKRNYVFSSHPELLKEEEITCVNMSPKAFIESLDESHQKMWLIGGPQLITQFINEQLVDELILFTMPVLLKEGIPLFKELTKEPKLNLQSVKQYPNGVIETHYLTE